MNPGWHFALVSAGYTSIPTNFRSMAVVSWFYFRVGGHTTELSGTELGREECAKTLGQILGGDTVWFHYSRICPKRVIIWGSSSSPGTTCPEKHVTVGH